MEMTCMKFMITLFSFSFFLLYEQMILCDWWLIFRVSNILLLRFVTVALDEFQNCWIFTSFLLTSWVINNNNNNTNNIPCWPSEALTHLLFNCSITRDLWSSIPSPNTIFSLPSICHHSIASVAISIATLTEWKVPPINTLHKHNITYNAPKLLIVTNVMFRLKRNQKRD